MTTCHSGNPSTAYYTWWAKPFVSGCILCLVFHCTGTDDVLHDSLLMVRLQIKHFVFFVVFYQNRAAGSNPWIVDMTQYDWNIYVNPARARCSRSWKMALFRPGTVYVVDEFFCKLDKACCSGTVILAGEHLARRNVSRTSFRRLSASATSILPQAFSVATTKSSFGRELDATAKFKV